MLERAVLVVLLRLQRAVGRKVDTQQIGSRVMWPLAYGLTSGLVRACAASA